MASAFGPFNGTFNYILSDVVNDHAFYLRDGDATKGQLVYLLDPDGFSGWEVEIDNIATSDFAAFYGPRGTALPPSTVGLYTTVPPAGFDPSTKVVTLVSITPVH